MRSRSLNPNGSIIRDRLCLHPYNCRLVPLTFAVKNYSSHPLPVSLTAVSKHDFSFYSDSLCDEALAACGVSPSDLHFEFLYTTFSLSRADTVVVSHVLPQGGSVVFSSQTILVKPTMEVS